MPRASRAPRIAPARRPQRAPDRLVRRGRPAPVAPKNSGAGEIDFLNGGLTLGLGGLLLGIGGVLSGSWLGGGLGAAAVVVALVLSLVLVLFGLTAFAFNDTGKKAQLNRVTLLGALLAGGGLVTVLGALLAPGLGLLLLGAGLVVAGFGMLG